MLIRAILADAWTAAPPLSKRGVAAHTLKKSTRVARPGALLGPSGLQRRQMLPSGTFESGYAYHLWLILLFISAHFDIPVLCWGFYFQVQQGVGQDDGILTC